MKEKRSGELFERAKLHIPGGVNSPVRAYGAVGRIPRFRTPGSGRRGTEGMRRRSDIWCPYREGSGAGGTDIRTDALYGGEPTGEFRNRGSNECDPYSQGIYRQGKDH